MNMKSVALSCLVLGSTLPLAAQSVLFSDALASAGPWTSSSDTGAGTLEYAGGALNYLVPSSQSSSGSRSLSTFQALPDQNWSVQVNMHLVLNLESQSFASLNLIVGKAADPANYMASFGLNRTYDFENIMKSTVTGSLQTTTTDYMTPITDGTTDATLLIAYDMTTSQLIYAYDPDGVSGSADGFIVAYTGSISGWNMLPEDRFIFMLKGESVGPFAPPVINLGDAYFSNFVVTSGIAVPEPSTTALLAGCAVLGVVVWWRRRAA